MARGEMQSHARLFSIFSIFRVGMSSESLHVEGQRQERRC